MFCEMLMGPRLQQRDLFETNRDKMKLSSHKVMRKGFVKVCEGHSTFWLPRNQFPFQLKCPLCFIDPYLSSRQPHSLATPKCLRARNGPLNEREQYAASASIPFHKSNGIQSLSLAICISVNFAFAHSQHELHA